MKINITKEELTQLVENGLTLEQITKQIGCCPVTIRNYIKKYKIQTKKGFHHKEGKILGSPKGTKCTEERKEKMRKLFKGINNPFYGKKHTSETKKKMSNNHADFTGDKNPLKKALETTPELRHKLSLISTQRWKNYSQEKKEELARKFSIINANSDYTKNKRYHRHHKSGWFIGKKCGKIFFRSSWEKTVCLFLENNKFINEFNLEQKVIPYINNENKQRFTRIDFIATLNNGIKIMIDVKPKSLLEYNNNSCKMVAYKKYCEENHIIYFLYYKNDIEILKEFIIALIGK